MAHDQLWYSFALQMGDSALVHGHRLSEWCGHGPILEQDIAITNIALDLVGQSRNWLQWAAELQGEGKTEDDLAYFRDTVAYRNVLLAEQPNEDWAYTIIRLLLYSVSNYELHQALTKSPHPHVAAIAMKSLKEITYHLRYASEWTIRLGDGTATSHHKMQRALDDRWRFWEEFLTPSDTEQALIAAGQLPDYSPLLANAKARLLSVLERSTLSIPTDPFQQLGGKTGQHTEHLGVLLAVMQVLPRTHPEAEW